MPAVIASRRGATLIELVLAVALLVPVVLLATTAALISARETSRALAIAEIERAHETAATILEAELSPLAPGDGILGIAPSRIRFRARRAVGRWCLADSGGVVIPLGGGEWAASRLPVPGRDSVVLEQVDSAAATGASPIRLPLAGPPVTSSCPGGAAGLRIPVALAAGWVAAHDLVQTEEVVELGGYLSGGAIWLGLQYVALGTPIEPLAGPFGAAGIVLTGLDGGGVATMNPAHVRMVRIELGSPSALVPPRVITIDLRG